MIIHGVVVLHQTCYGNHFLEGVEKGALETGIADIGRRKTMNQTNSERPDVDLREDVGRSANIEKPVVMNLSQP